MTRFARARGSKSSNERVAEEATSWNEFQRQLEDKKTDSHSNKEPVTQNALKLMKNIEKPSDVGWADFGVSQLQTVPKVSKKRKMKVNDDEETSGKKKFQNLEEVQDVSGIESKTDVKKKKKKHMKNELNEGISTIEGHAEEVPKKVKKGVKTEHADEKTFGEERDYAIDSITPPGKSGKFKNAKAFKTKDTAQHFPAKRQSFDLGSEKAAPQFKRRKPFIESSTINVNGVTINVTKYDGFDVKSEDAVRLKELRSKMLKEGIPRAEVDKAMKLERRKAEKALAREKKKVCFNCRKAGHLLSECPEVGSSASTSFDSSAVNLCYKCGSTEHTHYQCQVKKKKEYSFATCFICKEQGHISSQCPDNPRGLYPQGGSCKICGEVTHLKKDCPQLSKERTESTVTLDTFSSTSKLESLAEERDIPKKDKKISVKQRKVIKF